MTAGAIQVDIDTYNDRGRIWIENEDGATWGEYSIELLRAPFDPARPIEGFRAYCCTCICDAQTLVADTETGIIEKCRAELQQAWDDDPWR